MNRLGTVVHVSGLLSRALARAGILLTPKLEMLFSREAESVHIEAAFREVFEQWEIGEISKDDVEIRFTIISTFVSQSKSLVYLQILEGCIKNLLKTRRVDARKFVNIISTQLSDLRIGFVDTQPRLF